MKKITITLICLIMCIFIITSCTSANQPEVQQTEKSTEKAQPDTTTEPIFEETNTDADSTTEPTIESTTEPTTETTEEPTNPNIVSKLAEEDFLLPFENYSWEREYDTEYVLLHFSSNVIAERTNPYSVSSVKKIFEEGQVSAHYLIDRDGKIYCFIPENRSAWHAGVGTFANDAKYTNKMNKYSIGIEMLAIGSYNDMQIYLTYEEYQKIKPEDIGYTDAQYEALKSLLADICERNNINYDREHIIGHEEYNPNKNDPGELFDWSKLF